MAGENFRITTDYELQIKNLTTLGFYSIWVSGEDGNSMINIAVTADTTSTEIDWDYTKNQIPEVPSEVSTNNYRMTPYNEIQLKNTDTGLWHSLYAKEENNSNLVISKYGEE